MRYVLLVSDDENAPTSPGECARREAAYARFHDHMSRRGTTVLGERIEAGAAATTVRCWEGGDVVTSAGSNAPATEQLTGVFVVDCENLDQAIDVATTVPAAWFGTVVVAPVRVDVPPQERRLADQESLARLAVG